jgi:hypothetical protein
MESDKTAVKLCWLGSMLTMAFPLAIKKKTLKNVRAKKKYHPTQECIQVYVYLSRNAQTYQV